MKDYIINKIFIKIQDDIKIADNEYLSAKKQSYEFEKELLSELTDEQKNKLKELINLLTTIAFIENKRNFYEGFKTGANLILEIIEK